MTGTRRKTPPPRLPPPGRLEPEEAGVTRALGANVRRAREELGFTVARLAGRSGVPREALVEIEHGRSAPCIDELWKLASALGLPFAALVTPRPVGAPLPRLRADVDEPPARRVATASPRARPARSGPAGRGQRPSSRRGAR